MTSEISLSAGDGVARGTGPFAFGRNWHRYVSNYLDVDRERIAADSLRDLLGDISGKTFIDIGCGSGLFSLCAFKAQAREVVSLDVDPDAVDVTRQLHARVGAPETWRVMHRSILDRAGLSDLEPSDIVYAWGALHHTGDMYRAIANAAALVKPGGWFTIAIYNRVTDHWLTSRRWWHIKRAYNRAPRASQVAMEVTYGLYWLIATLHNRTNPVKAGRRRGMAVWPDLLDWLGGFPYEYATPREIIDFCERSCGLQCRKLLSVPADTHGNNQFVFTRAAPVEAPG